MWGMRESLLASQENNQVSILIIIHEDRQI